MIGYLAMSARWTESERFVQVLECAVGRTARKEYRPHQPGDVVETFANIEESRRDLGFEPRVAIEDGLARLVEWYREYYAVKPD